MADNRSTCLNLEDGTMAPSPSVENIKTLRQSRLKDYVGNDDDNLVQRLWDRSYNKDGDTPDDRVERTKLLLRQLESKLG